MSNYEAKQFVVTSLHNEYTRVVIMSKLVWIFVYSFHPSLVSCYFTGVFLRAPDLSFFLLAFLLIVRCYVSDL